MKDLKKKINHIIEEGFLKIFTASTVNKIINFAYSYILIRTVDKGDYGVYSYAANIYGYLMIFNLLGLNYAALQLYIENEEDKEKRAAIFSYCSKAATIVNSVICFTVLIVSRIIKLPINGSNDVLALMTLQPIISGLKTMQLTYLRANVRNNDYAALNIIDSVCISLLSILGAVTYGIKGLIISQYVAGIIVLLIGKFRYDCTLFGCSTLNREIDKKPVYKISLVMAMNNSLGTILGLLATTILGILVPDGETIASYKVASTIPLAINFIPQSVMIFALPYYIRYKNSYQWIKSKTGMLLAGLCTFNLLGVAFSIVFSKPIISILFGNQYLDGENTFRILMCSYFVSSITLVLSNILFSQRKLLCNTISSILGIFIVGGLSYLLIPRYGIAGSALATIISGIFSLILFSSYFIVILTRLKEKEKSV